MMKTKLQRINLLMQFMRGEVPASALKDHVLTYFHLMRSEHRIRIEQKIGKVRPKNCSIYNPNEPLRGLWDGLPIGATLMFHLSMVEFPDSSVQLIDCSNKDAFNDFLTTLPDQHPTTDFIRKDS